MKNLFENIPKPPLSSENNEEWLLEDEIDGVKHHKRPSGLGGFEYKTEGKDFQKKETKEEKLSYDKLINEDKKLRAEFFKLRKKLEEEQTSQEEKNLIKERLNEIDKECEPITEKLNSKSMGLYSEIMNISVKRGEKMSEKTWKNIVKQKGETLKKIEEKMKNVVPTIKIYLGERIKQKREQLGIIEEIIELEELKSEGTEGKDFQKKEQNKDEKITSIVNEIERLKKEEKETRKLWVKTSDKLVREIQEKQNKIGDEIYELENKLENLKKEKEGVNKKTEKTEPMEPAIKLDNQEEEKIVDTEQGQELPGGLREIPIEEEQEKEETKEEKQDRELKEWIKPLTKTQEEIEEIKIKEGLSKDLEEKRSDYIKADKNFKNLKKKEKEKTLKELESYESDYKEALIKYAFFLKEEKKSSININENHPDYDKEIQKIKADLFQEIIIKEQDKLAKEKVDNLELRQRTWFRTMIANYAKLPLWKKVLISTGVATGAMVIGGTIGGITAATIFGASRFTKGMVAGKLAALSYVFVKSIGTRKIEEYQKKEINELSKDFEVDIENKESNELKIFIEEQSKEYEKLIKEVNKKHRRISGWAIGAAVVVGGSAGFTTSHLDGPLGDILSQKLGLSAMAAEIPSGDEIPSSINSFDSSSSVDSEIDLTEKLKIETEPRPRTELQFKKDFNEPIEEEFVGPPLPDSIKGVEVASKGDSVWKMIERQLGSRYGEEFTELDKARQIYIIDSIKDRVADNPEGFGLTDIDKVEIGQKIDFSPVFEDTNKVNEFFNEAEGLTPAQVENIVKVSSSQEIPSSEIIRPTITVPEGTTEIPSLEIIRPTIIMPEGITEIPYSKGELIINREGSDISFSLNGKIFAEGTIHNDGAYYIPHLTETNTSSEYVQAYNEARTYLGETKGVSTGFESNLSPEFLLEQDRSVINSIIRDMGARGFNKDEYGVIAKLEVGKFLDQIPDKRMDYVQLYEEMKLQDSETGGLAYWGKFDFSEFKNQVKLAEFIRELDPSEAVKKMTITDFLRVRH